MIEGGLDTLDKVEAGDVDAEDALEFGVKIGEENTGAAAGTNSVATPPPAVWAGWAAWAGPCEGAASSPAAVAGPCEGVVGSPAVGRALLPSGPSEGVVVDVADGVAELDVAKGVGVAEGDDDDIDDKLGRTAEAAAEAEGKPEFPKLTIGMSRACRCMPSKAALVLGV